MCLSWGCDNYGFNAKISFEKYAPGPEILAKTSKIMQVWFGDLIFGTFCSILDPEIVEMV